MMIETESEKLARFITRVAYADLSGEAQKQLKIRILDALGCGLGALQGEPIAYLRKQLEDFGGNEKCTLFGGGKTAPDRAAFYNGSLIRYLDFNDSYLAKGETCHPSDNLSAVLAAAEYANVGGRDFLTALAVAYQVQCRLSDEAPVRAKGFDHTVQGSYAVAAGVAKALGLDVAPTAQAIAICGTAFNALRVTRTGMLSHWKGLAYPNLAGCCLHATFLASRGVTGPLAVFEGNKGFMESIAGPFAIDWTKEDLERVVRTDLKIFNAEIHSQSAIQGLLEMRSKHGFTPSEVERIAVDIFDVAYQIIGGGEEGDKTVVHTKEQADHSLPYLLAVALLDGQVLPAQFASERINRDDVQALLRKVDVRPNERYSGRFPNEPVCRLTIRLKNGRTFEREQVNYQGFHTNPMSWEMVQCKFDSLAGPHTESAIRRQIVDTVKHLDEIPIRKLTALLAKVAL